MFKKYALKLIAYLIVVFTPIVPTLLWLGLFVIGDLITGIIKAYKTKKPITSKGLSHTVTKLFLYWMVIIFSHVLDTQFLAGTILPAKITQLVAGFIVIIEFKSVVENISEILKMPLWKFIKNKLTR